MTTDPTVYDLGEIEPAVRKPRPALASETQTAVVVPRRAAAPRPRIEITSRPFRFDVPSSLSVYVPGAGHLVRREFEAGLFFLASSAFLGVLGWAILDNQTRIRETAEVLGLRPEIGAWTLGLLYVLGLSLYLCNVVSAVPAEALTERAGSPHPAIPAVASLLVPGWGQVINGDRARAALFFSGVWIAAASWLLVSPVARELMEAQRLVLPPALEVFVSPLVRWTFPAVVWTLAVYDAAASAQRGRTSLIRS